MDSLSKHILIVLRAAHQSVGIAWPGPEHCIPPHSSGCAASALSCLLSLTGSLPCRAVRGEVICMAGAIFLADLWPLPSGTNGQWVELSLFIDWISINFTGFLSWLVLLSYYGQNLHLLDNSFHIGLFSLPRKYHYYTFKNYSRPVLYPSLQQTICSFSKCIT